MRYDYTDRDGDDLSIWASRLSPNIAFISAPNAVFVKADEAPKAAQAILDAAGVKGAVIVGSNINVTLRDTVDSIETKLKVHEEAAAKKAHDDLRTSPIALKALALYNRSLIGVAPYASWADVNCGAGAQDHVVRKFIEQAEREEAQEKEAAEKLAARRDQLVRNHGLALDAHCYNDLDVNGKYLVDRLRIALDEKRDAK